MIPPLSKADGRKYGKRGAESIYNQYVYTFDGETKSVAEWAEALGMNKATLIRKLVTLRKQDQPITKALILQNYRRRKK